MCHLSATAFVACSLMLRHTRILKILKTAHAGEIIRGSEARIRERVYMAAGLYYLFDLEVNP